MSSSPVPRAKTEDKVAEKFVFPAADSEPDDSQSAAKMIEKKANSNKQNLDQASAARRKRRNSTSNLAMQYLQGDKLKVREVVIIFLLYSGILLQ